MSTKSKTLAKSLHTVSAIVAVAHHIRATEKIAPHAAVSRAVKVLGYDDAADPHDLWQAAANRVLADITAAVDLADRRKAEAAAERRI